MTAIFPDYERLSPLIHDCLKQACDGLSEYELLRQLGHHLSFFKPAADSLQLFRQHFITFHCLYRLQLELSDRKEALLSISPLEIKLQPYQSVESGYLAHPDPLRTYYLDLNQLSETEQSDVDDLIGEFWHLLANRDGRSEALKIIGLKDPVDEKTIKQRYRQLVSRHHPDRGGDSANLQLINAAMEELIPKKRLK